MSKSRLIKYEILIFDDKFLNNNASPLLGS